MNPLTTYNIGPMTPPDSNAAGSMDSAMDASQGGIQQQDAVNRLPEDYMPVMMPQRMFGPALDRSYFAGAPQALDVASTLPNNPTDPQMAHYLTNLLREKESSNNYQAVNPSSTASGAYQYTDSTWNGYGGYAKAALAPPEVQDRKFAQDIASRLSTYGGDPYKAIVAHYLPALANQPGKWSQPFSVGGRRVQPALTYLRYVIKGSPLEAGLRDYLMRGVQPQLPQPEQFASVN